MAFRGRGRGRGGFSYGRFAKEEKYEVFPEIAELPDVNFEEKDKEYTKLIGWADSLRKVWIASPYHLEDTNEGLKSNGIKKRKPPLSDYLRLTSEYFPGELAGKNVIQSKKTRWDLQPDLNKLDLFEKLDERAKTQKEKKEKEKKEEEEDEQPDEENVEEEEEDLDDDYGQNIAFDDDEDDFNMNDDHDDDEGCY